MLNSHSAFLAVCRRGTPLLTAGPLGQAVKPTLSLALPSSQVHERQTFLTSELQGNACAVCLSGAMQLINRVPTLRFYAKRGRRGEAEANPHIHHPFRSRWSLKFPQLPSSHLTGNISVRFPAPRNRRSFARLKPRESPDQPPTHPLQPATPGLAWPLGGQFHEAVSSGASEQRMET